MVADFPGRLVGGRAWPDADSRSCSGDPVQRDAGLRVDGQRRPDSRPGTGRSSEPARVDNDLRNIDHRGVDQIVGVHPGIPHDRRCVADPAEQRLCDLDRHGVRRQCVRSGHLLGQDRIDLIGHRAPPLADIQRVTMILLDPADLANGRANGRDVDRRARCGGDLGVDQRREKFREWAHPHDPLAFGGVELRAVRIRHPQTLEHVPKWEEHE